MLAGDINDIFEELLTDDEEDALNIVEGPRRPRIFRERCNHFVVWNDIEFKNRFRLSKSSVLFLLQHIENNLLRPTNRNHALYPIVQVLITLRFYATGSFLLVAGDFGGIHKSTASSVIREVTIQIASLSHIFIKMPQTNEEILQIKRDFYTIARFPNVIGAIDCTHIRIQSYGGNDGENYRNRKGYFSFNVQTVADPQLRIRDIVARWPGATHDNAIFANSRLKAQFEDGNFHECFLLGDLGYTLSQYMMIPLQYPQARPEALYNESQIRSRNVVERQYGVWKRRFSILYLTLRLKKETAMAVIVATAVLHNIAVNRREEELDRNVFLDLENFNQINNMHVNHNGYLRRQALIQEYFQNL